MPLLAGMRVTHTHAHEPYYFIVSQKKRNIYRALYMRTTTYGRTKPNKIILYSIYSGILKKKKKTAHCPSLYEQLWAIAS